MIFTLAQPLVFLHSFSELTDLPFAARLGQGSELLAFLETEVVLYDRPVPFAWMTEVGHPPTELRIEALTALPQAESSDETDRETPPSQPSIVQRRPLRQISFASSPAEAVARRKRVVPSRTTRSNAAASGSAMGPVSWCCVTSTWW